MDVALDLGYDQKMLQGGPPTQEIKAEIQQDYSRIDLFFQTLNVQYTLQKPSVPVSINTESVLDTGIEQNSILQLHNTFSLCNMVVVPKVH